MTLRQDLVRQDLDRHGPGWSIYTSREVYEGGGDPLLHGEVKKGVLDAATEALPTTEGMILTQTTVHTRGPRQRIAGTYTAGHRSHVHVGDAVQKRMKAKRSQALLDQHTASIMDEPDHGQLTVDPGPQAYNFTMSPKIANDLLQVFSLVRAGHQVTFMLGEDPQPAPAPEAAPTPE